MTYVASSARTIGRRRAAPARTAFVVLGTTNRHLEQEKDERQVHHPVDLPERNLKRRRRATCRPPKRRRCRRATARRAARAVGGRHTSGPIDVRTRARRRHAMMKRATTRRSMPEKNIQLTPVVWLRWFKQHRARPMKKGDFQRPDAGSSAGFSSVKAQNMSAIAEDPKRHLRHHVDDQEQDQRNYD